MRNLIECQAEVFRRSEERIKERKQRRKHILMACIPLALCITLFSAFILPAMRSKESADNHTAQGTMPAHYVSGMGSDGWNTPAGTVEVFGTGVSHSYTSVEDVQEIMDLINGIVVIPETDDEGSRDFEICEGAADGSEKYGVNGYSVIITRGDGTRIEYLLLGTMLIDQNTKEAFSMDEKTCFDLKEALGIPFC